MDLSFVIPVYNEAESLKKLYLEITANLNGRSYEIIFIDDGSTDTSFAIMKELAVQDKQVKVIQFRRNFRKAAALQAGFNAAEGDIIFTMDADLQDNPVEIPRFIEKLEEGYDLVTGWKKKRKDPLGKTLPSKLFNSVTSRTIGLKLHDYNCGYKAYRKEVVKELDIYGEMHRYIPALAHSKGFRVAEIVVDHRAREFGKSKYGTERYIRGFLDLLTVKFVTGFTSSPLYLFGRLGILCSILGLITGAYLTVMKYVFMEPLANRPLLFLAILLIMVGLQFISVGLLGELIVNQSRKNQKMQHISVAERINLS